MRSPKASRPTIVTSHRIGGRRRRSGMTLVWFAMLLTTLLGMVGLVIDAGMLMASHRQVQNAADAAALAAAMDIMNGAPATGDAPSATATAIAFVTEHNGLPNAPDPIVHIPPTSGAYVDEEGYVEVIASVPVQTFFIHILPGVANEHTVRARAVAGYQYITAAEGVAVLDPYRTGLNVSGTGGLRVLGLVIDNSEGRGKDENGDDVGMGENYYAGRAGKNSPAYAAKFHVVGGVDWPENFRNVDEADPTNVLFCGQLPIPDPLAHLPTPTVHNGVTPALRGNPLATVDSLELGTVADNLTPNYIASDPEDPNYVVSASDPDNALPTMVLRPGIYESIKITYGKVRWLPGIYVIRPRPNVSNSLMVTGGLVYAEGIMIYNTGHNYNANYGTPDRNDKERLPQHYGFMDAHDPTDYGTIKLNSAIHATPIDTSRFDYGEAQEAIAEFDGMLFYQRRRNAANLSIEGDLADAKLAGTLYAKWAEVKVAGGGRYDAQFVVGSLYVMGHADLIIDYKGSLLGKAPKVFLVE